MLARFKRINIGYKIKDKIIILIVTMLKYISDYIDSIFDKITNIFVSKVIVNIEGVKFRLIDYDSLTIVDPRFETNILNVIIKIIEKLINIGFNVVFLDIGAHIGKYSLHVGNKFRNKVLIYAFEPNPHNYILLKNNINLNKLTGIISLPVAVTEIDGTIPLFISDTSGVTVLFSNLGIM